MVISLQCIIVSRTSTGSSFNVEIDDGAKVSELKIAIKDQSDGLITVPPSTMQLFLTKTEGGWLPDNEDLDTLLHSDIHTSSYLHMLASWKLSNPDLFGPGVSLGEDVVHVLVVLKDAEAAWRQLNCQLYRR